MFELAAACEEAIERGKQLWPIAEHVDYRIALEAPAREAARVLVPGVGRFALGPLTEVAASTHTWADIAPHLKVPQVAAYVAQERVLRGEDLTGDERAHAEVLELPLRMAAWEPAYPLATFHSSYVDVGEPSSTVALKEIEAEPGPEIQESGLVEALLDLVQPWTTESNGAARALVVEGDGAAAIAALALGRLQMAEIPPDDALRLIAWAAASGGAHGRRRGAAFGRFMAWYVAGLVTDLSWPVDPTDLGERLGKLRFYRWDEGDEIAEGWILRIAIENPERGWSAALAATDVLTTEEGA